MNSLFDKFLRIVAGLAVMAVVMGGVFVVWPKLSRVRGLEQQRQQVLAEIEAKNREIAQLRENQRRFREDPDFVEAIARQNHRVFPGEVVFVFERPVDKK